MSGLVYGIIYIYLKIQQRRRTAAERSKQVPKAAIKYLEELKTNTQPFGPEHDSSKAPSTFGVYLGAFSNPPTPNQARLLTTWDLVVLDPLKPGVLEAISTRECSASQRLGRLDVNSVVAFDSSSGNHDDTRVLSILDSTIATRWRRPQDMVSPFTGILLANWQAEVPSLALNELLKYLKSLRFDVWLEAAPPTYLTPAECAEIDLSLVRGIVCRNGTIMYDGDRRNYFQMADMRRTQRALAKHMSLGSKTLMMWETIDDAAQLSHSVIKRSYNWCRFNTTVSWIGPEAALTDADVAARDTVKGEPLGALMWLKSNETMAVHDLWRQNTAIEPQSSGHEETYKAIEEYIPDLSARLALVAGKNPFRDGSISSGSSSNEVVCNGDFDGPIPAQSQKPPFSYSPRGEDYTGLGCFQIGLDGSSEDFIELMEGQRRLKGLDLLDRLKPEQLRGFADKLRTLYENDRKSFEFSPYDSQAVRELVEQLSSATGSDEDLVQVYVGIHSGFHHGTHHQYWGLHDLDPATGITEIYISAKTTDRLGTLLHTYLSSRQYTRAQCFQAEIALAELNGGMDERWQLPSRLVKDVQELSSTELMLLIQRLVFGKDEGVAQIRQRVQAICEYQLLEIPTRDQLREQNTNQYIRGEISVEQLIENRMAWYKDRGCQHPEKDAAVSLFREIEDRLADVLISSHADFVSKIDETLMAVIQKNKIDASADIFALCVFCAFRKLAIEEVYLEILDRNPLPNAHPDQASCFAEMFALGSQCETYLDMTSNVVGRILADKYRAYYKIHQPPHRDDKSTELPTAYASTLVDEDPNAGVAALPWYYQMTFLGIFAVPALVDILLLTTTGRGLYLSTFMENGEKTMATAGLMFGLLLVGGIGTWIGHGGSYYLHCMAFPVMNMFVLTRFIAGIALGLIVSGGGFIVIGCIPEHGWAQAAIFFYYFMVMSTYLILLATLAVYQFPGFMFQSGRITVVKCLPILLISPIITHWIAGEYHIAVYICVLAVFLTALILGGRTVLARWSSWYLKVIIYSDSDIVNWYTQVTPAEEIPKGVTDLGPTPLPRSKVYARVQQELKRKPWQKPTSDKMIRELAESYEATCFLMDWYCKYSRTKMPYPYSPTWNLQAKTAVDTLKEMQKGLKLHNAFVHWRHGGNEVWCGVLYFVIALMDKWVALVSNGALALTGLSAAGSKYNAAVGFGLAYYLFAAVCLDSVATPLWPKANKKTDQPITSLGFLKQAAINDAKARRKLYWTNWSKFFFTNMWGLAVCSALMWTFNGQKDVTIMFIGYVGAYTGLLCYQYNRIYTGALAMGDLIIAALIGIITGPVVNRYHGDFQFTAVISLAVATWTSALLSIRTANVGWPSFRKTKAVPKKAPATYYYSALGPDAGFSQRTLSETYDALCALDDEYRFTIKPETHPGVEVMQILKSSSTSLKPEVITDAFLSADRLVAEAASLWQGGNISIELVPARHFLQQEQKIRAVSRLSEGHLHIMVLVGLDLAGDEWVADIRRNCKVIAESVIQAAAEARFAYSRDHSNLAELLAVEYTGQDELAIPEGVKRQLEWSSAERSRLIKTGDKENLRYLLLGLSCDIDWDRLPEHMRSMLLKRCLGEQCDVSPADADWILARFCKNNGIALETHFARCNLGASLATLITDYAKLVEADYHYQDRHEPTDSEYQKFIGAAVGDGAPDETSSLFEKLTWPIMRCYHAFRFTIKFFVVSIVAEPEFQRELDYVICNKNVALRWSARFVLNGIWIYCKCLQRLILPTFMFYNRPKVQTLRSNMKGVKTSIQRKRVVIEGLKGPSTGFFMPSVKGEVLFYHYSGRHEKQPEALGQLIAVNAYTKNMVLKRREEYKKNVVNNVYTYDYEEGKLNGTSLPVARQCVTGERAGHSVQYDERGYITNGTYMKDGNQVDFKLSYRKHARFDDELLRAEFTLAHINMKVSWCVPPPKSPEKLGKWIPNPKIIEATFTQGEDTYHSRWEYEHRSHPEIITTLNGNPSETPDMITYDWFGVLKKPSDCSFISDNPLFSFRSPRSNIISRALGMSSRMHPVSTSLARTHLWQTWKGGKDLDAVTARWLDEMSLRADSILRPYWAGRDMGQLRAAGQYLDSQADAIMARFVPLLSNP